MILHPSINEIAQRRQVIDKALRAGSLDTKVLMENFAYIYKDGPQPILGMGRSGSVVAEEANDNDASIPFIITTVDVDRDSDQVLPMGIQLDHYSKNPVVFFGHQSWEVPIGVSRSVDGRITVYPEENRATAVCYFDKADPDAMFIYGKCKRKVLSATSIAFVPIKASRREDVYKAHQHDGTPNGYLFEIVDLTEWSIVGVPANPGATTLQKSLRGELRDALDREKSFISPRLQKALVPYCATASGCWNGWCPCPTTETKETSKVVAKSTKHACSCKSSCACKIKGKSLSGSLIKPVAKKLSIQQTDSLLRGKGYSLYIGPGEGTPNTDLGTRTTSYPVKCPDGSIKTMTTQQILTLVGKSLTKSNDLTSEPSDYVHDKDIAPRDSKGTLLSLGDPVITTDGSVNGKVVSIDPSRGTARIQAANGSVNEWEFAVLRRKWIKQTVTKASHLAPAAREAGKKAAFNDLTQGTQSSNPYAGGENADVWQQAYDKAKADMLRKGGFYPGDKVQFSIGRRTYQATVVPGAGQGYTKVKVDQVEGEGGSLQAGRTTDVQTTALTKKSLNKALNESSGTAGGYLVPEEFVMEPCPFCGMDNCDGSCNAVKQKDDSLKSGDKVVFAGPYGTESGTVVSVSNGQVKVRSAAGQSHTVAMDNVRKKSIISKAVMQSPKDGKWYVIYRGKPVAGPYDTKAQAEEEQGRLMEIQRMGKSIRKYITHDDNKWIVHAESGKVLGTHDTKAEAEAQLRAVESSKHKSVKDTNMATKKKAPAVKQTKGSVRKYDSQHGDPTVGDMVDMNNGEVLGKVTSVNPSTGGATIHWNNGVTDTDVYLLGDAKWSGSKWVIKSKQTRRPVKSTRRKSDSPPDSEKVKAEVDPMDEELIEDQEAETNEPLEEDAEEKDMEGMSADPSAVTMANLYSRAKAEDEYLQKAMAGMHSYDPDSGEENKAKKDLMDYHQSSVMPRMEAMKDMMGEHHPDADMEKMCKGLETTGSDPTDAGEGGMVDQGYIPEDKGMDDQVMMAEDDEDMEMKDEPGEDPDKEAILERYQTPKGYKTRKAGTVRRSADGRLFLVKSVKAKDLTDEGNPAETKDMVVDNSAVDHVATDLEQMAEDEAMTKSMRIAAKHMAAQLRRSTRKTAGDMEDDNHTTEDSDTVKGMDEEETKASDARIGKGSDGWWIIENNKKVAGPYQTEAEAKHSLLEYTNNWVTHALKKGLQTKGFGDWFDDVLANAYGAGWEAIYSAADSIYDLPAMVQSRLQAMYGSGKDPKQAASEVAPQLKKDLTDEGNPAETKAVDDLEQDKDLTDEGKLEDDGGAGHKLTNQGNPNELKSKLKSKPNGRAVPKELEDRVKNISTYFNKLINSKN